MVTGLLSTAPADMSGSLPMHRSRLAVTRAHGVCSEALVWDCCVDGRHITSAMSMTEKRSGVEKQHIELEPVPKEHSKTYSLQSETDMGDKIQNGCRKGLRVELEGAGCYVAVHVYGPIVAKLSGVSEGS